MSKDPLKLNPRYGSLKVVGERTVYGRRVVDVTCDCGTSKEVYADALRSGRTRSCGAISCRRGKSPIKVDRKYKPRGNRQISDALLRRIWHMHEIEKTSGVFLSVEFDLNRNTLYSIFRAIRKSGGIDAYFKRMNQ